MGLDIGIVRVLHRMEVIQTACKCRCFKQTTIISPDACTCIDGSDGWAVTGGPYYSSTTWTRRDPVMTKILYYTQHGSPTQTEIDLQPYWQSLFELTVEKGCIMWGGRVIVPPQDRKITLAELHGGHPGISRMKSLVHRLVWWPGLTVKQCSICQ